ncbi:hypothetical protein K458DRAFT_424846 [Lentithecium fluviatile CBS 122367]|uniref:Heterokaryon incompatibility domain-containing protein n=1 Tax=Lentithecium fluviatile CBS 122367 TaxID=1168545 RepID=A0A6G1IDE3_9PLEO|nr:hypothetical protein K458DRAFT_424846 [Lentithecium fluviatile CBS 122367]
MTLFPQWRMSRISRYPSASCCLRQQGCRPGARCESASLRASAADWAASRLKLCSFSTRACSSGGVGVQLWVNREGGRADSIYNVLDEPRKMIRLLKILSITPQVSCQLKVVSLEYSPVFSALSYMWGDANITEPIVVDGKTIPVTVNLANAIRDVHYQWTEGCCSTDPLDERWLWADAVCINQQDVQEKNHQVPLMKDIYPSARRVFSWLGTKDKEIHKAFDVLDLIWPEISQLPSFPEVLQEVSEGAGELHPGLSHAFGTHEWLKKYHDDSTEAEPSSLGFLEVPNIFEHAYWTRVWIFQEVALAREITFICGTRTALWVNMHTTMLWFEATLSKVQNQNRPYYVSSEDWLGIHLNPPLFCRNMVATKNFHRKKSQLKLDEDEPFRANYSVLISRFAGGLRATNPKDYVYGLEGVTGFNVPTEYGADKTVAQVYQKYAIYWLSLRSKWPSEKFLVGACDLWFLDIAGVGFLWKVVPGLPTWSPNFAGVAEAFGSPFEKRFSCDTGHADSGVFPDDCPAPQCVSLKLQCNAVLIDEVIEAGPYSQTEWDINDEPGESVSSCYLWMFDCTVKSTTLYPDSDLVVLAMAQALSLIRGGRETPDFEERSRINLQLLITDLEYVCRRNRGIDRSNFFESLHLEAPPFEKPRDDFEGLGKTTMLLKAISAISKPQDEVLQVYIDFRNLLVGLCMASTDLGFVGLFPPLVQKNDIICILKGCPSPVVLRKKADCYIHVGLCYIPGLMEGEARDRLRDARAKMEEIVIC